MTTRGHASHPPVDGVAMPAPRAAPPSAPAGSGAEAGPPGAALPGGVTRGRDRTVDVLRGLCILSMTYGHAAPDSAVSRLLHMPRWADGAFGFVFLSGLVLGMVHRRNPHPGRVRRRILRRTSVLYTVHVALVLLAVAFVDGSGAHDGIPSATAYGGWARVLGHAMTFRLMPTFLDILPLYVVFLPLGLPVMAALRRHRAGLVVGVSATVWLAVQFAAPVLPTGLPRRDFVVQLLSWQLLFVVGLVIGWHRERVEAVITGRPRTLVRRLSAAGAVASLSASTAVLALADGHPATSQRPAALRLLHAGRLTGGPLSKDSLGVLALADFVSVGLVLARLVSRWVRTRPRDRVLHVLDRFGQASLQCYVASTVVAVAVTAPGHPLTSTRQDLLMLPVLALLFLVGEAVVQRRRLARGRPRLGVGGAGA